MLRPMTSRPETPRPAHPAQPRESAVGIVMRRAERGWEVLVGLRSRRSRFLPGNWAFLGGRLEQQDRPGEPGAHRRCASREVQEETTLVVPPEQWLPAGLLVTPPMFPLRYRTEFFLAEVGSAQRLPPAPPIPEEIEALAFVAPEDLLGRWERGEVRVPPILPPQLREIGRAKGEALGDLARRLITADQRQESCHRIEFVPGIWVLPVATETLPPATHTNVWMPGEGRFLIVDPGSSREDEIERLLRVVRRRQEEGSRPEAILLSHHHPDHAAAAPLLADRLGLPLWTHPATLERVDLPGSLPRRKLVGGELLDLEGLSLRVHHTPGHAPGHLALECLERRVLLSGDLVSRISTILIDPEDGDMTEYLDSLERMTRLDVDLLLPSHGPPVLPKALVRLREHREERERAVLAALAGKGGDSRELAEIADRAYLDKPEVPRLLIEAQTLSHLRRLAALGRVRRLKGGWAAEAGA